MDLGFRLLVILAVGAEAIEIAWDDGFDAFNLGHADVGKGQRAFGDDIIALEQFDLITRNRWSAKNA